MASIIEFIIVFACSLGVNAIPFAGPSNILIPTWFPNLLVGADTATLVIVGFLVASGATIAKGSHYMVRFFISGKLREQRRKRLDADAAKVRRWAFPLLFLAATSPIPDEPIVIPLGLMKYSPAKFFGAYFFGKLTIAIAGAFLGGYIETSVSDWISQEVMIAISVVLTITITVMLLKVDFSKFIERILHKKPKAQAEQGKTNNQQKDAVQEENKCPPNNADTP